MLGESFTEFSIFFPIKSIESLGDARLFLDEFKLFGSLLELYFDSFNLVFHRFDILQKLLISDIVIVLYYIGKLFRV